MSSEQTETTTQQTLNDFEKIEALLASVRADATKFYVKGNNSAGTRLRKVLLDIKNSCHTSRKNVQSTIKERKDNKKSDASSPPEKKKSKKTEEPAETPASDKKKAKKSKKAKKESA